MAEGREFYSGTNWLEEKKAGRIDNKGYLYEGTNLLDEKKIGRIDGEGNIYEGMTVLNEKKVGRIDDEGNIYTGQTILDEKKIGRIGDDGRIYTGTTFLDEKQIGRAKEESGERFHGGIAPQRQFSPFLKFLLKPGSLSFILLVIGALLHSMGVEAGLFIAGVGVIMMFGKELLKQFFN